MKGVKIMRRNDDERKSLLNLQVSSIYSNLSVYLDTPQRPFYLLMLSDSLTMFREQSKNQSPEVFLEYLQIEQELFEQYGNLYQ